MLINWATSVFCFYLLSYQLKYVEGNIYNINIASSLSEISGCLLSTTIYKKFGLKKSFYFGYMLALLGMIGLLLKIECLIVLILVCRFGISTCFSLCYLSNIELLPVNILSTSYGICNFVARLSTT